VRWTDYTTGFDHATWNLEVKMAVIKRISKIWFVFDEVRAYKIGAIFGSLMSISDDKRLLSADDWKLVCLQIYLKKNRERISKKTHGEMGNSRSTITINSGFKKIRVRSKFALSCRFWLPSMRVLCRFFRYRRFCESTGGHWLIINLYR